MLHRRKSTSPRRRIVRPSFEPGEPPPLATPEDRDARKRFTASLAGSLLLHAAALAALAWSAATFVRVAADEDAPPVFVTLLAGTPADRAGAPSAPTERVGGADPPPAAGATEPQPAAGPPAPLDGDAEEERARTTAHAAPPARPGDEPRADPAPRAPAPAAAEAAPAAREAPAGAAVSAVAAAEGSAIAARTPAARGAVDVDRVYGEGEVDRIAAPLGGIRRPEYPARERMLGREGRVSLVVTVDAGGAVREVQVARSAGEAFDASARRAVERTPFRAARVAERAVASTVTVDVSFELD